MINNELQKYYAPARRYSNQDFNYDKNDLLTNFSHKIPKLLEKIRFYAHDKHYIYSSFFENKGNMGQGARMISKILIQNGFEMMDLPTARMMNKPENLIDNPNASKKVMYKTMPSKKPRFILAINSLLKEGKESSTGLAGKNLDLLRNIFNSPENRRGEYIQVFIASQGYNEGIDLKAVKHIHIFEPLITKAMDTQTIGRAARMCSHSQFTDKSNWTVKVHRYFSDYPSDVDTIDDLEILKDKIYTTQKDVDDLVDDLEEIKGIRNPELKKKRENIKNSIDEYKKKIKEFKLRYKNAKDIDLPNLKMVDSLIYNESTDRDEDIRIIYDIMRKTSIDSF
jgi:hypothetical protein